MHAHALTPSQLALAPYCRPGFEAAQYHDASRPGYLVFGYSTATGRQIARDAFRRKEAGEHYDGWELGAGYRQRSLPLREMPRVLADPARHLPISANDPGTDIWVSQGEFTRPNRQKINLARIAVCWVDIDLRHEGAPTRLSSLTPDKALALVLARIAERGLPPASMVLWTGRGLCIKWYTDVLPKAAYPRWAAAQAALVETFADLGADAAARDASRILRLAGTYNSKSGTLCEPIYVNEFFGEVQRTAFDDIADAVLPFTRQQLAELRAKRAAAAKARKQRLANRLIALEGSRRASGNLQAFNPVRLAWLQLDDYRKLASLRAVGQRPEGWTNSLVWLATSALAVAVWADADRWDNELASLCRELAPHWSASRIAQATSTVRSRMQQMSQGMWVDWQGKKRPPVYTPRHSTILQQLGVTDAEAEQLFVIIPNDLARERDRLRQHERRRGMGVPTRQQWLESHEQRRAHARLLRA